MKYPIYFINSVSKQFVGYANWRFNNNRSLGRNDSREGGNGILARRSGTRRAKRHIWCAFTEAIVRDVYDSLRAANRRSARMFIYERVVRAHTHTLPDDGRHCQLLPQFGNRIEFWMSRAERVHFKYLFILHSGTS